MPGPTGPIEGFGPLGGVSAPKGRPATGTTGPEGASFGDLFKQQLGKVDDQLKAADRAIEDLATGRTNNIAEVMTAVEKADLAFKTMMQIRNKLLAAYREISRMQT